MGNSSVEVVPLLPLLHVQARSGVADMQDLLNEAYALLDTMIAAMSSSLAEISSAEGKVQQVLIEKQFAEIRKQMEVANKNLLLKIFMPLLMAFGIIALLLAPMDPVTKVVLVSLLLVMLADSVMNSAVGEGFLKAFFEKMTNGNTELAKWLMLGFEALVLLTTLFASLGCASGNLIARLTSLQSRVQTLMTSLANLGGNVSSTLVGGIKNLFSALGKLTALEQNQLAQALRTVPETVLQSGSAVSACFEKLAQNPLYLAIKDRLLTTQGAQWLKRACDYVMILSGITVGVISIDKTLVEMQLAAITEEIEKLGADADLIKSMRKDFLDTINKTAELQTRFDEQLQSVVEVWRSN